MFWQNRLMLSLHKEKNQKAEQFGDASVETGLAKQYLDDVLDDMSFMLQDQSSSQDVSEILEDQKQALEAVFERYRHYSHQSRIKEMTIRSKRNNKMMFRKNRLKKMQRQKSGKQSALRNKTS